MAKHSFEKTWPRWAGTVADLENVAREAAALIPDGTLKIELHRLGLGTSEFATGPELSQALTVPDLARVDLVAVRVDRPKAHDLSLVAVSFTSKVPAVTIEAKGANQELVSGALSTLSRAIESGVQFPRSNYGRLQTIALIAYVIFISIVDVVIFWLAAGKPPTGQTINAPPASLAVVVLADALLLLGAIWLLPAFELMPAGLAPRLQRLWAVWVVPYSSQWWAAQFGPRGQCGDRAGLA